MNILFVHHGAISANSMNHIGPFADEMKRQGHEVAIAVPELDPTFRFFPYERIPIIAYEDILNNPQRFQGEGPHIVHAWTPREIVRLFCEQLWQKIDARWIIHMEDDESVVGSHDGMTEEDRLHRTDPLHGPWFMELADAFTVIIASISDSLPTGKPALTLFPGFDQRAALRNLEPVMNKRIFSIPEEFKVITYPGAASGANTEDLTDLYQAIHLLNEHGTPSVLMKTGFPDVELRSKLPPGAENWIKDVGYLSRNQMWRLIEMADVVVQPGRINSYNQHRLPSKLPDFLCLGKPLITSAANLGTLLVDGEDALLLQQSDAQEIAARCQELFSQPKLASKIASNGQIKGKAWFDLGGNTRSLLELYERILKEPKNPLSIPHGNQIDKTLETLESELATVKKPSREALRIRDYLIETRKVSSQDKTCPNPSRRAQIEFQVFYPQSPELLEQTSLRRWYRPKVDMQCLFPFSPSQDLDWIRIDPGQFPGTYILKSWSVLDDKQKPLLEWKPNSTGDIICQITGASLGPVDQEGQELWSLTHDPQLLFAPLPNTPTEKIRWLKFEFRANEVESPLTGRLKLKRQIDAKIQEVEAARNRRIDAALETLERRQSLMLRTVDRIRKG